MGLINIHFFLLFLAFGFAESFGPVYFYKIGLSLSDIAIYWAIFFIIRALFRPIIIHIAHAFDLKKIFSLSILFFSGRYILYSFVKEPGLMMVGLLVYEAMASTMYWVIYHAYFAALSSNEKAGTQVATRDMMLHFARLLSPFIASLIIDNVGFSAAFIAAAAISASSVLPLLNQPMKEIHIKDFSWKKALVVDKSGAFLYGVAGIQEYGHNFLWRLVIFLSLGSYVGFGALLSLSILFQIVGNFFVGRHFDRTKSITLPIIGLSIVALVFVARSALPTTVAIIVGLDIIFVIGSILHGPYVSAINYQRSKKSHSTLLFQFWSELGWDCASISTLLLSSLLLSLGVPLKGVMLLGIIGIFGTKLAIKRYR